jgi:hypothetical protein
MEQQAQGARPQGPSMLGKGLGVKALGVKSQVGGRCERHYLEVSPRGVVPGGGPAAWVAEPLRSSPGPPKAWLIEPESPWVSNPTMERPREGGITRVYSRG